jgi:hypothetical protein
MWGLITTVDRIITNWYNYCNSSDIIWSLELFWLLCHVCLKSPVIENSPMDFHNTVFVTLHMIFERRNHDSEAYTM